MTIVKIVAVSIIFQLLLRAGFILGHILKPPHRILSRVCFIVMVLVTTLLLIIFELSDSLTLYILIGNGVLGMAWIVVVSVVRIKLSAQTSPEKSKRQLK